MCLYTQNHKHIRRGAKRQNKASILREGDIFILNSTMTAVAENEDGLNVRDHAITPGWLTGDITIVSEPGIFWNEGLDGSMASLGVIYHIH
ncbi:hypothetical protein BGX38DRAFT_922133 [Terfezia claveryi]|nr:hypothetical protein BGX38DRAFT_922133 [Terfezia claveryi]